MSRSPTFQIAREYYTFTAPNDARFVACTDIVTKLDSYFAQRAIRVARHFQETGSRPIERVARHFQETVSHPIEQDERHGATRRIELPRSCPHEFPCSACRDSQFLRAFTHDGHPSPFAGLSKLVERRGELIVTEIVRPNHGAVVTWVRFGKRFHPVCGPWYIAETRYHYGVGKTPDAAVSECLIAGKPKPDTDGIRGAIVSVCRQFCSPTHAWPQNSLEALATAVSRHVQWGYPTISLCGLTSLIMKLIHEQVSSSANTRV